jgi:deazaflavin-dependent oxidoreductase (nitroreductase family)
VQRALQPVLRTKVCSWFLARTLHHLDGPVLRLSHGRFSMTSVLAGLPVVTVTTIGARSGQPRSLPLIALPVGEDVILVASNFGQRHHPAWYYNLCANPQVQLTCEGHTVPYTAREATGDERERCWQRAVALYSGYALYKERAGNRQIPVVILTPGPKQ